MNLKIYNAEQQKEIQRVYDEIKWYLGEELKHDPCFNPEDKKIIEGKLAELLISGFGEHLRNLNKAKDIDCNPDNEDTNTTV
jgi:hypothetical protein